MILASQIALKRTQNNEEKLRRELTGYFTEIEEEVTRLLQEYGTNEILLQGQLNIILSPIKASQEEYYNIIKKHILQEYEAGVREGDRLVQLHNPEIIVAEVINEIRRKNLFGTLQYTEDRLLNKTFIASQRTLERVDENINKIITDGYRSGKGMEHVGRQINERFQQLKTWEARRIARTEIHGAHNEGVMKSYETLGVEYTQWVAHIDKRTRPSHGGRAKGKKALFGVSHESVNGEIIPFGETYSNGLAYPGDTSGPIEEWINCRCSNAPFVMPAGMMAPPYSPFREEDLIQIK